MARPTSPWHKQHNSIKVLNVEKVRQNLQVTLWVSDNNSHSVMTWIIKYNLRLLNSEINKSVQQVKSVTSKALFTCVKPSLIRLCLKVLANCSSSSRSLGSSRLGESMCFGVVWLWGRDWMGVAAIVRVGVAVWEVEGKRRWAVLVLECVQIHSRSCLTDYYYFFIK